MNTPGMARLRALRLAKDAMDRDWAESALDLDAVAAHAGYSRYHFVRAFKAAYGETPGQYLSRRRIERAEELLRSANLTVTEICMLVGFTSLGTFSARFKKHTGTSPSEYRVRHARRAAAMIPGCYAMLFTGAFKGQPAAPPAPSPDAAAPEPSGKSATTEKQPDHRSDTVKRNEGSTSEPSRPTPSGVRRDQESCPRHRLVDRPGT